MANPETRTLTVVVTREDGRYVAQCVEADVSSFGDTHDEAVRMVTEALELWFEGGPTPRRIERAVVAGVDVRVPG